MFYILQENRKRFDTWHVAIQKIYGSFSAPLMSLSYKSIGYVVTMATK